MKYINNNTFSLNGVRYEYKFAVSETTVPYHKSGIYTAGHL